MSRFLKRMLIGILSISIAASPAFAQIISESKQKKPNIVYFLVDNTGWGSFGVYGGTVATPNIDKLASQGIRFNNYNVEVQCTPSRSAIMTGRHPVRSGTYTVPWPGQGKAGMAPWEYTIAKLLSDSGYATALYGKWHLGDTQGRMPNDQGFDEWWGIPNTWDEAGYTQWPLFKESGVPIPMVWEGKKGQKSKAVMPLDLKIRPVIDEKYIIPKTVEYIKKMQQQINPSLFMWVIQKCMSHQWLIQTLPENPLNAADSLPIFLPRWTTAWAKLWMLLKRPAWKTTPFLSSVATTLEVVLALRLVEPLMDHGVATSSIPHLREVCVYLR